MVAFVLGGFIEQNWTLTAQLMALDRIDATERPAALVIAGLVLVSLIAALRPRWVVSEYSAPPSDRERTYDGSRPR